MKYILRVLPMIALVLAVGACAGMSDQRKVSLTNMWFIKHLGNNRALTEYRNIHIGWVDLKADDWQTHGYSSQAEWVAKISEFNNHWLQQYTREQLQNDKTLTFASAPQTPVPPGADLSVSFEVIAYLRKYSPPPYPPFEKKKPYMRTDQLLTVVTMTDVKKRSPVYKAKVRFVAEDISQGWGFAEYNFENRVGGMMKNIARYLYWMLTDPDKNNSHEWDVTAEWFKPEKGFGATGAAKPEGDW